jgi:protein SCO1/2
VVKLVFVTTDPARDSPVVLSRWLDLFHQHFIGLTGTERAIAAVERIAGVANAFSGFQARFCSRSLEK